MVVRSVLLVDDDPDIRRVGEIGLRIVGGLEVWCAESGPEALELLGSIHPDVVVLDVMMPGMDGPDTLRAIRERSDVPVVFLTAKAQQREVQRYLGLGAAGVIPKPFDPMELAQELQDLLAIGSPEELP